MSEAVRVLYVDGDPDRREAVRADLEAAGLSVLTAAGADRAVEVLGERGIDCVVCEYRLPGTDGLSFFERVYPQHPDVPVVLYTAHGSEALAGEALAAGVAGYVPREEGTDTLVDRIDSAIAAANRGAGGGPIVAGEGAGGLAGEDAGGPASEDGSGGLPAASEAGADRDRPETGGPPGKVAAEGPSLRLIFESLGDAVYALDREGRLTAANGTLVRGSGYAREDLVGEHVSRIMPQEDVRRGVELILELLAEGDDEEYRTYEATLLDRDGREVPCEVSLSLLPGEDGFQGTVGVVREITERKRMADRVRERKRRIESLHGVASRLEDCADEAAIYETTVAAARRVLEVDGCAVHGVEGGLLAPLAYAPGGEDEAVVVGEDPPPDPPEYAAVRPLDGVFEAAHRTGETRRVEDCRGGGAGLETHRSLLVVPVGERALFCAVAREPGAFDEDDAELAEILTAHVADALDRVASQTELRRERDRFAALFENVPDPVVYSLFEAGEPVVQRVNPAFERVFGFEESEIAGERLDDYVVPADERARGEAAEVNERARRGEPSEVEVRRRTAEGLRTFLMTVVPVDGDDGEALRTFGLYTDITERRQRRERLEVLNRVLRHDLRNGMNVVQAAAEIAAEHVDEEGRPFVETIGERAGELLSMAEKTRTVERTLGRVDTAGPVDVAESARETAADLGAEYPDAEIDVETPGTALVAAGEFVDDAVRHVAENAIVHNDREHPTVEVRVSVTDPGSGAGGEPPGAVVVEVADDGPGIPDEERALFDDDREITQLRHASGLGLWLVNWVVTRAGGTLAFEDRDPRGTLVRIRLPLAREPPALAEEGTAGSAPGAGAGRGDEDD